MYKKVALVAALAAISGTAHAITYVATFEDAATLGAVTAANNSAVLLGGTGVTTAGTFSTVAIDGLYFEESTLNNLQVWDLAKATALGGGFTSASSPISTYMAALGTTATATQTEGNWIGGLKTSANSFSFKSAAASTFSLDSIWLYIGKTTTSATVAELTITGYDTSGAVVATYTQFKSALGAETLTLSDLGSAFSNVASVTVYSKDGVLGFDNITTTLAVPEPSTYAMLLAGLGMMGFMARRRTRA
jgi:hypothetical protein